MELEQAVEILEGCERWELRDHAFGDTEVTWTKEETQIASGYFSGSITDVCFGADYLWVKFEGDDARRLRECGTESHVSRNDETGPDDYTEGDIMPGLSKGDVYHELTGDYLDED